MQFDRATALALFAVVPFAATLRIQDNVLSEEALQKSDPNVVQDGQEMCTTDLVQEEVRCGVDRVIEQVTDGLRCGFEWCDTNPTYLCAKTCSGEGNNMVSVNATCKSLLSCPVRIIMHVKGSTKTTNMEAMKFKAELISYEVKQKSSDIGQMLDDNKAAILPYLEEGLRMGLEVTNQMLAAEVQNFESGVVSLLEQQVIGQFETLSRYALGGRGLGPGLVEAVSKRFAHIGADMHRRAEVSLQTENTNEARLCHRMLRIRRKGGEPYYIKDWRNALVARKIDHATNCNSAYTAHCGTGVLTKVKKCHGKKEEVTKQCLFGATCWSRYRTIHGSAAKEATLYKGGDEVHVTEDVWVDHVSAGKVEAEQSASGSEVVVQATSSTEDEGEELPTLVEIHDDKLPRTLRDEVCTRVRKTAWYGFGWSKNIRCRLMLKGIANLGTYTTPIPIGSTQVTTDVSIKRGKFKAQFIPDWAEFSKMAEAAVFEELKKLDMPLQAELKELNLKLDGDGDSMNFEVTPVLDATLSKPELDALYKMAVEKGGLDALPKLT